MTSTPATSHGSQLALLGPDLVPVPKTEGIKYAGSKQKILGSLISLIQDLPVKTVLDGFAGTTKVSQAFAGLGYQVTCNDTAVWSKVFGMCHLSAHEGHTHYRELIDHLNGMDGEDGWFTQHYGGLAASGSAVQQDGLKRPWQNHNTRKLDGVREEIDRLDLSEIDRAVALTSLIYALDKVDNTIGHYAAYLKDWSPRSYNDLQLKIPLMIRGDHEHRVLHGDIFDALSTTEVDLAYFDPPYGSNNEKMPSSRVRYASYYHVWTTVCLNDRPELFGKVSRRADSRDTVAASVFEEFRRNEHGKFIAVDAVERLIDSATARFVVLSYSSGGRATADELLEVLRSAGTLLRVESISHKENVMAGMKWTNDWTKEVQIPNREFLFLVEKH